jgi:S1-C subfamily serine protease
LDATGDDYPPKQPWLDDARESIGKGLRSLNPDGPQRCRATGWVKQIGGKVLPLALLQIDFEGPVPPPGTPLLDPQNRVAAVVFQKAFSEHTGYAIPAEAVHRVRRDVCEGGILVRAWLGLTLNASNPTPRVVRVLPDSPAATAGIQPGDLLLQVGSRATADYADVANAFFYLVPGEPTRLSLMRGPQRIDLILTPSRPR